MWRDQRLVVLWTRAVLGAVSAKIRDSRWVNSWTQFSSGFKPPSAERIEDQAITDLPCSFMTGRVDEVQDERGFELAATGADQGLSRIMNLPSAIIRLACPDENVTYWMGNGITGLVNSNEQGIVARGGTPGGKNEPYGESLALPVYLDPTKASTWCKKRYPPQQHLYDAPTSMAKFPAGSFMPPTSNRPQTVWHGSTNPYPGPSSHPASHAIQQQYNTAALFASGAGPHDPYSPTTSFSQTAHPAISTASPGFIGRPDVLNTTFPEMSINYFSRGVRFASRAHHQQHVLQKHLPYRVVDVTNTRALPHRDHKLRRVPPGLRRVHCFPGTHLA
ncbi:hypothetical protein B0H13DRAFT_1871826 [Mycena leptocephala]|nr:hypothetical protein B0H13DRAFT_1871826 [Mycena leptocephala]